MSNRNVSLHLDETLLSLEEPQSQGTHSNGFFKIPCVFPIRPQISVCRFMRFVTITFTKLTWQTYLAFKKIGNFHGKYGNIFYL